MFEGKEHYDRLRRSAQLMKMPFNYSTVEMMELTYEVLQRNNFTDAYVRPIVRLALPICLCRKEKSLTSLLKHGNGQMVI